MPIGNASTTGISPIGRVDLFNPPSANAFWDESTFELHVSRSGPRITVSNRNPTLGVLAILVQVVLAFAAPPARDCTTFVLTDTNHALFCNNEDWSDLNSPRS